MKRFRSIFIGMIAGVILTSGFLWIGAFGSAQAQGDQPPSGPTAIAPSTDEGAVSGGFTVTGGGDEIPPEILNRAGAAPDVLPTAVPGETLVYFVPTDNDATATVLYLYNTDSVAHIVALRGYSYNGVLVYSLNINVAATSFLRLASDSIVAAPPPSWATPAPIITNFTDFTYLVSLSLPKGVKVEGYTLYNSTTGTVDPRVDQGAVPLRFSTDPATVFLPSVQSAP